MAFVTAASTTTFLQRVPQASATTPRTSRVCTTPAQSRRAVVRMGVGEDGLADDLSFARNCIDEGCSVESVQDVLTRLERRRAVLALELQKIEEVMAVLAKENLGGNRSLIADAMAAAVSIFATTNDDYPNVGEVTNAWTLDPLRKQPKM